MSKTRSPFKDNEQLRRQIGAFLKSHGTLFAQEAKRTSSYFELAAYNDLVRYYETNGYKVKPANLKGTSQQYFNYAMSTTAKPENCSYFTVRKRYKSGKRWTFEIRHNLRIQSAHDEHIFVTPDYAVIDSGSIRTTRLRHYYNGKSDYAYVDPKSVRTFGETKHYNPSPEMVLNFVGVVNEIKPGFIEGDFPEELPKHCGPCLFVSGVGNAHTSYIRNSLAERYRINVFLGLFAYASQVYSARNQHNIKKIGTS